MCSLASYLLLPLPAGGKRMGWGDKITSTKYSFRFVSVVVVSKNIKGLSLSLFSIAGGVAMGGADWLSVCVCASAGSSSPQMRKDS